MSAVNEFGQSEPLKAETPIIAKMPFGMISVTIFIHFVFRFFSLKYERNTASLLLDIFIMQITGFFLLLFHLKSVISCLLLFHLFILFLVSGMEGEWDLNWKIV